MWHDLWGCTSLIVARRPANGVAQCFWRPTPISALDRDPGPLLRCCALCSCWDSRRCRARCDARPVQLLPLPSVVSAGVRRRLRGRANPRISGGRAEDSAPRASRSAGPRSTTAALPARMRLRAKPGSGARLTGARACPVQTAGEPGRPGSGAPPAAAAGAAAVRSPPALPSSPRPHAHTPKRSREPPLEGLKTRTRPADRRGRHGSQEGIPQKSRHEGGSFCSADRSCP